jgi:exopolysaccharide production protein ExoZ
MATVSKTIDGLQVLRGVAASLVVLHHARLSVPGSDYWPSWGSSGVDIFFVISGFVMALTTQQTPTGSTKERFLNASLFFRKRVARIVPLYWLAILWTTRRDLPDLNLIKDFLFIPHWNEQFLNWIAPIVQQGWTLNLEMFFYALFAVSMLFGSLRLVVLITTLLAIPPLANFLIGSGADVAGNFYSNDIIYEFGFGVLLQRTFTKWSLPNWNRFVFISLMLLGLALLAWGYERWPRSVYQGLPALLIVWASFRACEGWLRWRLLALLGDASYAIYLFHWASFGAMKPIVAIVGPSHTNVLMVLHILTAVIFGVAIHLLIEKRITRFVQYLLGLTPPPVLATT